MPGIASGVVVRVSTFRLRVHSGAWRVLFLRYCDTRFLCEAGYLYGRSRKNELVSCGLIHVWVECRGIPRCVRDLVVVSFSGGFGCSCRVGFCFGFVVQCAVFVGLPVAVGLFLGRCPLAGPFGSFVVT